MNFRVYMDFNKESQLAPNRLVPVAVTACSLIYFGRQVIPGVRKQIWCLILPHLVLHSGKENQ